MDESTRIVILGKTGTGKSSLANTIFGETVFNISHSPKSGASKCQSETRSVNGTSITLIDTPGFFDTRRSEEEMKTEIVNSITECAPPPHVFLIVLKVEKFTEQEKDIIEKLQQCLSEEALKYAVVVFTHGDQLPEEMTIEEFVNQSADLSDLMNKCSHQWHVIDNKYWKNNKPDEYRSNQFQVAELLNTIEKINKTNKGGCYTSEILHTAKRKLEEEKERLRLSSPNMSQEEITHKPKTIFFGKLLCKAAGFTTGVLLGAFFGGAMKLMNESGSKAALVAGVAMGAVVGIKAVAQAVDAVTAEAPATSVTPAAMTADEHQQ